jgi:hypothetical protein
MCCLRIAVRNTRQAKLWLNRQSRDMQTLQARTEFQRLIVKSRVAMCTCC